MTDLTTEQDMSRYILDLPEIYRSVSRPVNLEVCEQLLTWLDLRTTQDINFNGDNDSFPLPNSALDDQGAAKPNKFSSNDKLFITTEETESPITGFETQFRNQSYPAVFYDEATKVYVAPIYTHINVTVNIVKRFRSRTEGIRFRNHLEQITGRAFINPNHTIRYHYAMPMNVMEALYEVWRRRELKAPYGMDINAYFRKHFTDEMTVISDMAGNNPYYAIREVQSNVIGQFDFTRTPYPVKSGTYGSYEMSFSYKYEYDRISHLSLEFPIQVHNQLMPEKFLPVESRTNFITEGGFRQNVRQWSNRLHKKAQQFWVEPPGYVETPYFDMWNPPRVSPLLIPQFKALIELSDKDQHDILRLTELGEYELFPEFLDYIKHCGDRVFRRHKSLVHIQVYSNEILVDDEKLHLDRITTDVRCLFEMNLRHNYRFCLFLDGDLAGLDPEAVNDLLEHGWWLQLIIGVIVPGCENKPWYPIPDEEGKITLEDWVDVINHLPDYPNVGTFDPMVMMAQLNFCIIARNKEDGNR